MKIGLLYDMRYRRQQHGTFPRFYAETLEHMQAMERLGFESVNMCEHHFDADPFTTTSVLVWNAAMAVKTTRALIGQDLLVLPFAHPVRVAEDLATIDILSNGRLWLQAGEGYRPVEFETFGISIKQRAGRTAEGMEIIRKCFTEDVFSYEGRYFTLPDVRMFPKPVQKPHPPMFLSAQRVGQPPMERALRMGWNITTSGAENWKEWHKGFVETAKRLGKDPAKVQTTTFFALFVTNDPEREWSKYQEDSARTAEAADRFRLPRSEWPAYKSPGPRPGANPFMTPDDAAKFLRRCFGENPPTRIILWSKRVGMTYAESAEHHRLLMDKVVPQIRDLL